MSTEFESRNYLPELENTEERAVSRFGDKKHLVEIMESGEMELLGKIDDLHQRTTPIHANIVELVTVRSDRNTSRIRPAILRKGTEEVVCVWKPHSGENGESKRNLKLRDFYPQETAAYLVSEHFNFDLVPPTITRPHQDEIGSLQLFMPHENWATSTLLNLTDEEAERIDRSIDGQTMAVFDFILANCERHEGNYVVKATLGEDGYHLSPPDEEPITLVAIDHGISLSTEDYAKLMPRGFINVYTFAEPKDPRTGLPILDLYGNFLPGKELSIPIPELLQRALEDGLRRREALDLRLHFEPNAIHADEVSFMWQRVKALLETKKFLSKRNYHVFSPTVLENPPHPAFPHH